MKRAFIYIFILSVFILPKAVFGATLFAEPGTDATRDFFLYQSTTSPANSTLTSDNTTSHTGPRSYNITTTALGVGAYASTPAATAVDAGTRISMWVRFSSVSPSTATIIASPQTVGSVTIIGLGLDTDNTLKVSGRGATAKNGTTVLSANIWYRISMSYKITSASNWSAQVFLDGKPEVFTSGADGTLAAITTNYWKIGFVSSASIAAFTGISLMNVNYDDIYIDNVADLSDPGKNVKDTLSVTAKRPNTSGTVNGFTTRIGGGGSGYGTGHSPQVNEQPMSVANGWSMVGLGSAVTEEYNVENKSTGDVDITNAPIVDIIGWIFSKALVGETVQIVINGSNFAQAITSTVTAYEEAAGSTTYPAGTGTDIGEITDTSLTTVSLYETGILVVFNPAPPTFKYDLFRFGKFIIRFGKFILR